MLDKSVEPPSRADVPALLKRLLHTAELHQGISAGGRGCHTSAQVVVDVHLNVDLDLPVELSLVPRAIKRAREVD